ncbi:MAG: PstS family phosphate ABC transporter substrate-binding protein [Actinobacteria bacterium]|nr:PstS family phosphate ABC transporter substrate-binding protein [Actinomycetota bacterium]
MNHAAIKRKKITLLIIISILSILISSFVLSGCRATVSTETTTAATTNTVTAGSSGVVKFTDEQLVISGSTTLLEVSQAWAEEFMNEFGGSVTINGGGSGVGISDLINGTNDLANSSRAITSDEIARAKAAGIDVKEYKALIDGVCIITSRNVNISELSIRQLSDIYIGNYTSWKQIGGIDAPIVAMARDSSSGTGEFFLQKVVQLGGNAKSNDYSASTLRLQSNADVVTQIEDNINAIGYIGLGYLKDAGDKVNLIKVKSSDSDTAVAPNEQTISDFTYPISRYCYIYANGNKISKIARAYIDFVLSPAGQALVEQAGFVKVK